MIKKPLAWVLVATALFATACAQSPGATPSPKATASAGQLGGTRWLLKELNGAATVSGSAVTAEFTKEGKLSGTSGCNRYGTTFTTSGNSITVGSEIASTLMACEEALMKQETAFLQALTAARTFTLTTDKLTLTDSAGKTLTTFAVQSQKLAGTSWQVTMYNNGKEAVVGVITGTKPTVVFGTDGTVSGTGGCNNFSGGATVGDGTIKIDPLASTRKACESPEGVMAMESALLMALESAATYAISADKLELRTAANAIAVSLTKG